LSNLNFDFYSEFFDRRDRGDTRRLLPGRRFDLIGSTPGAYFYSDYKSFSLLPHKTM